MHGRHFFLVYFLHSSFHFKDCGEVVASKFFPIDGSNGKQNPLCERDYFRRLNLICEKCGMALRGSYITACSTFLKKISNPDSISNLVPFLLRQEVPRRPFYVFTMFDPLWTPGFLLRT